jgi:hypothetical protein
MREREREREREKIKVFLVYKDPGKKYYLSIKLRAD